MSEPQVTSELAAEHGLTEKEYQKLLDKLGRTPSYTELGIVSVMWSEHCSYKSSRIHLKNLPTAGPRVIQGPGENAGVVDIGDNQAVVFKMESHNHPSFIEPYQGAATGVGGICRDVFTMGARPIALADCLRFGEASHPKTSFLVNGVVAGISGYGNSFGVPTIAGDVSFDSSYNGNNLVNAFCLGLAPADKIFLGTASGVGNPILYVGAKTGRDGIHGATMASAEFDDDSEEQRPAVQVGDPFMEKLLLEACLELMQTDCLVGIQDMGAAGLTSSSVEMADRAGSGVSLDLDKVPMRETKMSAYEIMLSESQERMLMVVHKGREQEAIDVFTKWDLDVSVIGEVTDTGRVVVSRSGKIQADLPADFLAEGLVYERPTKRPTYVDEIASRKVSVEAGDTLSEIRVLLSAPTIASKRWVYEQYDHNVRHGTVIRPGAADAGMVRVLSGEKEKGVAVTAGCNERAVYMDAFEGTRITVAEAYANLACVGAEGLSVTNCLNFGNPEKPEIMWQFAEAVRGISDACTLLGTPVVSGNVSLYNETNGEGIKPTPMIAMVGLIEDVALAGGMAFSDGDLIAVVGSLEGNLAGSSYLDYVHHSKECGVLTKLTKSHKETMDFVRDHVRTKGISCAHDISDGGLAIAVIESCIAGGVGAQVDVDTGSLSTLYGEGPARFVIGIAHANKNALLAAAASRGVELNIIGEASGDKVRIGDAVSALTDYEDLYENAFANALS